MFVLKYHPWVSFNKQSLLSWQQEKKGGAGGGEGENNILHHFIQTKLKFRFEGGGGNSIHSTLQSL